MNEATGPFKDSMTYEVVYRPIGVVHTPYRTAAPYQVPEEAEGHFTVELAAEYAPGLEGLERFRYAYLLTHLHLSQARPHMRVEPPWADGRQVGLFASRSPNRPNPIGLSVVRVLGVEGRFLRIGPVDLLDGTPVLDIKPYVGMLDAKADANEGWIEDLEGGLEHLLLHVRGIPHAH